jgi:hypothetical protein
MIYTKENLIYADNYTTYSMIVPLTKNGEYQLTLTDTFGDGLTGDVTVYLGEEASVDKVFAYFGGSYENFSYSYTLDFVVAEDATITGLFPIAAPSPTPPVPSPIPVDPGTSPTSTTCADTDDTFSVDDTVARRYCTWLGYLCKVVDVVAACKVTCSACQYFQPRES